MSNSIKRHVVLLDGAGPLIGSWVRLDTKYTEGDNRAIQGTVAGGTITLEGTTVENIGGIPFGQDVIGNGNFNSAGAWIYGPNWTLGSGVASSDGSQTVVANLTQANHLIQAGSTYTVSFDITNYVAGTITPILSGTAGTPVGANGSFTETLVAGDEFHRLNLQASATFIGDISNIVLTFDVPAADINILQTYAGGGFSDVLNSSWTYIRASLDAGTGKIQGNV